MCRVTMIILRPLDIDPSNFGEIQIPNSQPTVQEMIVTPNPLPDQKRLINAPGQPLSRYGLSAKIGGCKKRPSLAQGVVVEKRNRGSL